MPVEQVEVDEHVPDCDTPSESVPEQVVVALKVANTDVSAASTSEHDALVPHELAPLLQAEKAAPESGVAVKVTDGFVPENTPEQVSPQLIPAGKLVIVPLPFLFTVSFRPTVNMAVAVFALSIVTAHDAKELPPEQVTPDHDTKEDVEFGTATSVTLVLAGKLDAQLEPQLIPLGVLVTVPDPSPLVETDKEKVLATKLAEAVSPEAVIVREHAVPEDDGQAPLQPPNVLPSAGLAMRFTVAFGVTSHWHVVPPAPQARFVPLQPVLTIVPDPVLVLDTDTDRVAAETLETKKNAAKNEPSKMLKNALENAIQEK